MRPMLHGIFVAGLLAFTVAWLPAAERPRLAVLTDIGGDPDDQQSMIHLMVYSNEFDIEMLMATALREKHVRQGKSPTNPQVIEEIVGAYGNVLPHLRRHAAGWPTVAQLRSTIISGNPKFGREQVGDGHDTSASRRLIECIDAGSAQRPLHIALWGGQTDLAQALWRVKQDRGPDGFAAFARKLRVFDVADQDRISDWMHAEFPGLHYILAKSRGEGDERREGTYRGMYVTGDLSTTTVEWVEKNIRATGPLGALYPTKAWTVPNPNSCFKEGDSLSWLFFLPLGGNNPADPTKPGWGGQYQLNPDGWYGDLGAASGIDCRETVSQWRPDFQRDFARRMAWCRP